MKQPRNKMNRKKKLHVAIYVILRLLVIACMVIQIIERNYHNIFLCILTLVLFMIPTIVDKRFNIELPSALEYTILLFIFAAEILGEINSYYVHFPQWDTMLHTINGFLMAAIGFSMIDILNQHPKFHINMSPAFIAFTAFCFSMTIGVIWEFFEFAMDYFTLTDMQKDAIIPAVSSVLLNPDSVNVPFVIKDIQQTVITGTVNGQVTDIIIPQGYLDVGIGDTMKDLLVNCVGAIIFSVLGIFYIKGRGKFAQSFIPQLKMHVHQKNEERKICDKKYF